MRCALAATFIVLVMAVFEEPPPRYWTKASIETLAKQFDLPNLDGMQDWAWEVADPERISEFCKAFSQHGDADTLFTLMDIVIESFEDSQRLVGNDHDWGIIEKQLCANFDLHAYQIWYWSAFDSELDDAWRVSPAMRVIWAKNQDSTV